LTAAPADVSLDEAHAPDQPTLTLEAEMANVAVIYYSSTGNVHALAEEVAVGATEAGAEVRLRRVAELAPDEAIDTNPAWRAHLEATSGVPEASHDDLRWADAYAFGTPARYGNVSSQLKQFLDTTAALWATGELADKPATAFTSAINRHGGNESTLLALYNSMHHWGAIVVAPGYTHEAFSAAGGNPYGTAHPSGDGGPGEDALAAARHQGARLARIAVLLRAGVPAVPAER
jgi:NAD(P)H dehydrogenase (quinone)